MTCSKCDRETSYDLVKQVIVGLERAHDRWPQSWTGEMQDALEAAYNLERMILEGRTK